MKKFPLRRFLVMLLGLVVMSFGVTLFKLSATGNDPCNGFGMALGARLGVDFSIVLLVSNCVWFALEFAFGRKYIGIGTFANWFGVGPMASLMIRAITPLVPQPLPLWLSAVLMVVGMLVLSLSVSLYQTPALGTAPYDVMAMLLRDRCRLPYFWCRVLIDSLFALAAWLLGGVVGLGTLVTALGLGPFITFFNKHVSEKLCRVEGETHG